MPTILKSDNTANYPERTNSLLNESTDTLNSSNSQNGNIIDLSPNAQTGGYRNEDSLSNQKAGKKAKKRRLSRGKMVSLILIIISVLFVGSLSTLAYSKYSGLNDNVLGQGSELGFWGQLGKLANSLTNHRDPLKGEEEGRTNILMIGRDATGSGLTDTIMIGSYYYKEKKFVTLNIPRDFYVYDGNGSYKINAVYPFAEQREPGSGEQYLADFLSKEFGIPIHYWASIDFGGVSRVVDELGGIEVDVENTFTDCQYPDANMSGYIRPCPTFTQGKQKLDGRQALIYARSRKGDNGEGSDFARSKRQSKVIQAIAKKAKESGIILNASKVNSYFDILGGTLRTNARIDEILSGYQLRDDFNPDSAFLRIVWDTSNGILCDDSSEDGAYIIVYCDGAIAGRKTTSRYREQARGVVQNMLQKAEFSSLYEANVKIYGNLSNETDKAYNAFNTAGFTNVDINNNYNQITPATYNSTEKVSVYIKNQEMRDLFNRQNPKPNVEYEVFETLPESKIVPAAAKDADIIVWVESVK